MRDNTLMKRVLLVAGLMLASIAAAQTQKWEYARFTFTRYALSSCEQPLRIDHSVISWEDSKTEHKYSEYDPCKTNTVASAIEFNQIVYGLNNNILFTIHNISHQNALGKMGWEMLSMSDDCENQDLTGRFGKVNSIYTISAWYKRLIK